MHAVGFDIHRNFAEAAEIRDGVARQLGRFDLVRAIAHAKVKTDKIDALTLAKLHAAGFLPEV